MLLAAFLAAAIPPAIDWSDQAGNRMDELGVRGLQWYEPREPTTPHCSEGTAPRWCAALSRNADSSWNLTISNAATSRTARVRFPAPHGPHARLVVERLLVRGRDGSVMVGVLRTDGGTLARGEWQKTRLILVRVTAETEAIVLDLPITGSASLRACFNERDRQRRRGACTDDYGMTASFIIDRSNTTPTPAFEVETNATTYPGRRSRRGHSRRGGTLRAEELTHLRDPICSYRRIYRFDAAAGRYRPDSPVPACADYLDFE